MYQVSFGENNFQRNKTNSNIFLLSQNQSLMFRVHSFKMKNNVFQGFFYKKFDDVFLNYQLNLLLL